MCNIVARRNVVDGIGQFVNAGLNGGMYCRTSWLPASRRWRYQALCRSPGEYPDHHRDHRAGMLLSPPLRSCFRDIAAVDGAGRCRDGWQRTVSGRRRASEPQSVEIASSPTQPAIGGFRRCQSVPCGSLSADSQGSSRAGDARLSGDQAPGRPPDQRNQTMSSLVAAGSVVAIDVLRLDVAQVRG